jgi:thioredoxin reductase
VSCDVAILGAGPAGAAAAVEASARGLRTLVVDEQVAAGGQVYRTSPPLRSGDADGDRLRAALAASTAELRLAHRLWNVERDDGGYRLFAVGPQGPLEWRTRALIVASGAQERFIPFPGWDLPGVMGLAAATILLKSQQLLPGRNVVVAGTGPLLYAVAHGILEGGGGVAALVDAKPRSAWWTPALLARPDLMRRGMAWMSALRRARVPILRASTIDAVTRDGDAMTATVNGHAVACDAVCCGFGLMPSTDVTRLLGASHAFDAALGGWHVVVDDAQRCDLPGLFAAGDVAGIRGAASAPLQGRIAAQAIAGVATTGRSERERASRFGRAMTRVAQVDDRAIASIPAGVTMCVCERLSRATIEAAIDDGCVTVNDVKGATRCGMGPCGGRMCEDAVARLIAVKTSRTRAEIGMATGRPPLRPVPLDAIAGDFDYETLPMPAPAPL